MLAEERGVRLFYAISAAILLWFVLGLVLAAIGLETESPAPLWEGHIFLLVGLWIPQLAAARIWSGREWVEKLGIKFSFQDIALGIGIGIAFQLFLPLLYLPLAPLLDSGDVSMAAEDFFDRANGLSGIYLFIVFIVFLGPLVEEIFFRGFLQSSIFGILKVKNEKTRRNWSIFLSALIFAGLHFLLVPLLGLFVFGLLLGYVRHKTGRTGLAVVIHMGFNFTSVMLLLIF